jgi:hypothetical protein
MIYGLFLGVQEKEIQHYCFPCGKILMAALDLDGSVLMPCKEDECPHEEKRTEPVGTAFDDTVCLRKLKTLPAAHLAATGGKE